MSPRATAAVALFAVLAGCGPEKPRPTGSEDSGTTTPTGTPPGPGVPVETVATEPVGCTDPSLRKARVFERQELPAEPPKPSRFWAGGVVVADFTGDDIPDIVQPGYHATTLYVGQPDGTWLRDPQLSAMDLGFASGGAAADYDGDGDLDLFITRFLQSDRLLRNDGGTFVDVTTQAGITGGLNRSMASTWGDYDGDGDLDLFVGAYGWIDESGTDHADFEPADPAFLFRNEGDGTFADLSDTLPQEVHDGYTFVAVWLDFDRDGRPELYVVNDFGVATPNQLLWNRGGGVFEPDDGSLGLRLELTAMGLGIGDLNEDGKYDFVMPEWNGIITVESSELGPWLQSGFARGITNELVRRQKVGWGAEIVDMDYDGDVDVPVVFGYLETDLYDAGEDEPDALYEQDADGKFSDTAARWGFADEGDARGFVVLDLNADGWLDVVKRDVAGPTQVMTARCGPNHWLGIRLRQPGMNRFAIGASVRVFEGDHAWMRPILAGGTSHASAGPPEVHFGLGDASSVRRVEITWPDGEVSNLFGLDGDRMWTITRSDP